MYEGISSFLHNRRHKALHNAVKDIDSKTTIQCKKLMHLEDWVVMCGIYNAELLEKLINTVDCIHNITSPNEKKYLWDSKAQHHIIPYMLMDKAYNITP